MDELRKSNIIAAYEKRAEKTERFFSDKIYMDMIGKIIDTELENDNYEEPTRWTEDIDRMFSFLFDSAFHVGIYNEDDDEVFIKYDNKFTSLFEIHGQGCFRRISPVSEEPPNYVTFEDIVAYEEEDIKPIKVKILDVVYVALDGLEAMSNGLCLDMNIDEVRDYLRVNLK